MKTLAKVAAAVALLVALMVGGAALVRRHAGSTAELNRARAGVSWHMPRTASAPAPPRRRRSAASPSPNGSGSAARPFAASPAASPSTARRSPMRHRRARQRAQRRRRAADGDATHRRRRPLRLRRAAAGELHASPRASATHSPAVRERRHARSDDRQRSASSCASAAARRGSSATSSDTSGGTDRRRAPLLRAAARAACVASDDSGAYRACLSTAQSAIEVAARGYGAVDAQVLSDESAGAARLRAHARGDHQRPRRARRRRQPRRATPASRSTSGELGPARSPRRRAAVTDEHGRFTLAGLAPGRHRLFAFAHELAASEPAEVNVDAGTTSPRSCCASAPPRASAAWSSTTSGRSPARASSSTPWHRSAPAPRRPARRRRHAARRQLHARSGAARQRPPAPSAATTWRRRQRSSSIAPSSTACASSCARSAPSPATSCARASRCAKVAIDVGMVFSDDGGTVTDDDGSVHRARAAVPASTTSMPAQHAAGIGGLSPPITLAAGEQRTGVDIELSYARRDLRHRRRGRRHAGSGVWVNFSALHKPDAGRRHSPAPTAPSARGRWPATTTIAATSAPPPTQRHHFAPADGAYPTVYRADDESEVAGVRVVIKRAHLTITGTTVDGDGASAERRARRRLPRRQRR